MAIAALPAPPAPQPLAKRALAATIRALRERLLADLHGATEGAYRLSVRAAEAGLSEAAATRRARLEGWIDEQRRAAPASSQDFRRDAEQQAAYTLLNRLVILRLMEAAGTSAPAATDRSATPLRRLALLTGGYGSRAYRDLRELGPGLVHSDESEGFGFFLKLVFDELAVELPGLFGPAGVADLVPVPAATLRHAVETLDDPALAPCWNDPMTLGWVYQYWNDPEREALDAKLNAGGKVERHEIASKTQMFTERYMVDWLLQNSLGPMWLAICQKHGWTPDVAATDSGGRGVLDALEARRAEWRAKRDAGQLEATELMPLYSDLERRWAYYVPQPIPDDAVASAPAPAPDSIRDLRILDPAVGSGHFLVVAFDLLVALYREEARHRGQEGEPQWGDSAIVERILEHNLHGIDLDPRAVQIAAAALWLEAKRVAPAARPQRLELVAANLRLAALPADDPALLALEETVERETGLPAAFTAELVEALRGADHLGSLLRVDRAVEDALTRHEAELGRALPDQADLFRGLPEARRRVALDRATARGRLVEALEAFLARHAGGDDLGLRLRGEQLAAGVRFVRLVREGSYDLVVANPPYQGTAKMADSAYVSAQYKLGKADLYAAFLLRGLELVRPGGVSAMLTMRNWMFIKQYAALREHLLERYDLRGLGDFDRGAFEDVPDEVVSVVVSLFRRGEASGASVALCPTPRDDNSRDAARTSRKRAATLCQVGRYEFDPAALRVVPEWPLVYWWDRVTSDLFSRFPTLADTSPAKQGMATSNNQRFLRAVWELPSRPEMDWAPYIKGAAGQAWFDASPDSVKWTASGTEVKLYNEQVGGSVSRNIKNEAYYFRLGVAFSMIGAAFTGRVHRRPSIIGHMGSSVFPASQATLVCLMNSSRAREILTSLNPGIHFEVGDVNRLPLFPIANADDIFAQVEAAFGVHESHREPSVEFLRPGPSPWRHAQDWAQAAVDRPEGAPLPEYVEVLDAEPPTDHISYALGVALGRFGGGPGLGGEGILDPTSPDPAKSDLSHALPAGILFLDGTLAGADLADGLGAPACAILREAWKIHAPRMEGRRTGPDDLRDYLRLDFFKDVHRAMYENRPIHWPLSSAGKTFVAWVNIHRFGPQTLTILLADHLQPARNRIEGELGDLRATRDGAQAGGDAKAARAAEKRFDTLVKARDELDAFIAAVEGCAEYGPPPTDASPTKCPPRERDARYAPDLDDGVMINSAALWPLLDPQWKDPVKWWRELAAAKGKKDYDWSHLAKRYWPSRVDAKCRVDPSLGVAHGCFWRYHPARAWAWELRLQDEIGPEFRIEEADDPENHDGPHRAAYLRDHWAEALAAVEKEAIRRIGRGDKRAPIETLSILEPGLWTDHPAECWALELRVMEKQRAEFTLRAPDEPAARAAFVAANPSAPPERAATLARLREALGAADLFGDEGDEDESEGKEGESEDDEEREE